MSEVRWVGKTGGGSGGNAKSLAPCAMALAFEMERLLVVLFDGRFGKLMDADDMDSHRSVPYRLRRHGAYDLAGRVAASFWLDFFGPFFIKEKRTLKP